MRNLNIDYKLLKHTQKKFTNIIDDSIKNTTIAIGQFDNSDISLTPSVDGFFDNDNNWKRVWDGIPFESKRFYTSRFEKKIYKFKIWFKSLFLRGRQSPIIYFKNVKESIEELNNIDDKILYLDNISDILRESKQNKMLNVALSQKSILIYEKILKDNGFKKFISNDNLVSFTIKCKKGLCLDYLTDFKRIIPESVISKVKIVEDLKVFDNYVILHYDPNIKKISLVEKKDPILFGVIKNSDKLYFIDDWIDEKCDLTYDKIIKELNIDEEIK